MGGEGSGKPKAALLKLDGTQIDHEGNVTKSTFFDFLQIPIGDYANVEKAMTPEAALKFRNTVIRMKTGTSAAIPMLCPGDKKCHMGKRCPFSEIRTFPVSEPCPLEVNLVQSWTRSYVEDLGVDPASVSQMALVNRLVEIDLLDYRANIGLSGSFDDEAPTLLKTSIMEGENGCTENTNVHPLLDVKSKFHHERLKTLEALVATRREKYKKAQAIGKSQESDAAKHMVELGNLVNAMQAQAFKSKSLDAIKEEANMLQEKNENEGVVDTDWEVDEF